VQAPSEQLQPVSAHLPQVQSTHEQSSHWQEPAEQHLQSVQLQASPQQAHPPELQQPPVLAAFDCVMPSPLKAKAAKATENSFNM
jgi:hypothetical protein